jgi:2-hydroxymuconate-semialdehyde hydrolase
MRALIELFAHDHTIVTDDLVELRFRQSADAAARASYEAMFPPPRQRWLDDLALPDAELRGIEQRTLVVHGREDRVIPLAASLQAFDLLPNAELHAFGHCGHWVQIEQTRRFLDVVTDFLRAD